MARRLRTIGVWNMKVGRGRAAIRGLRALIRDTDADAVLLQEAKNYLPAIRLVFALTWRIYGGPALKDGGNCAVMVRRTIPRGKHGRVRNRTVWYYRGKGRNVAHEGRVWRYVRADGVWLASIHKATEALGYNAAAGREEADNLAEWFGDHDGPMLAAGDFNNRASDRRTDAPVDIAKRVRGEVLAVEENDIDIAIVRGLDVTVRRGKSYGSDHASRVYRLQRP